MGTRALGIFVYLKIPDYSCVKQGSSKLFLMKLYNYKRMRLVFKILNQRVGFIADLSKRELC